MPLYEYQCAKCGRKTEKIENVSGPHLKKCPHCGGKVERLLTAPAIQFKGSGWYVTDYGGKATKNEKSESESSTDSKSEKTDKKTKESSPKKTSDKPSPSKAPTGD